MVSAPRLCAPLFALVTLCLAAGVVRVRPLGNPFPNPDVLSLPMAETMVRYCGAAYCPKAQVVNWTCAACVNQTAGFNATLFFSDAKTNTNGYVGYHLEEQFVLVAFEGSTNFYNWLTNLNYIKVDFNYPNATNGAKVHSGFFQAYNAVAPVIEAEVNMLRTKYPDFTLYVTGHSLGGATATLCALDFALRERVRPIQLYTFGSPRVGNSEFADFVFNFTNGFLNSIRVTHFRDIVPHLPQKFLGFWHIPREIWQNTTDFTGANSIRICNLSGEDPTCSDGFPGGTSIADHGVYLGYPMSTCPH